MDILKNEFKKIWRSPLLLTALAATVLIAVVLQLFTGNRSVLNPRFTEIIYGTKAFRQQFAGPITEQWILEREAEMDAILHDPDNKVGPEKQKEILEELRTQPRFKAYSGYSDAELLEIDVFFMSAEGRELYNQYEDIAAASDLMKRAAETRDAMVKEYLEKKPGVQGVRFGEKVRAMYDSYIREFQPNYGWHIGYDSIHDVMKSFPCLAGIGILIGLAPLFSQEYSRKTAGLLLTSRYGRRRLAWGKICAGFLTAGLIWALFAALSVALAFFVYGPEGGKAFWQGGFFVTLPYQMNQIQALILGLVTSLVGTMFFAGLVMLLSSLCRSRFTALVIGAVLLLIPMIGYPLTDIPAVAFAFLYTPTTLMRGAYIWEGFRLVSVLGEPVMIQWTVLAVLTTVFVISLFLTVRAYCGHQVKA